MPEQKPAKPEKPLNVRLMSHMDCYIDASAWQRDDSLWYSDVAIIVEGFVSVEMMGNTGYAEEFQAISEAYWMGQAAVMGRLL